MGVFLHYCGNSPRAHDLKHSELANIDESGPRESEKRETPPLSPSQGEPERILSIWNSFPDLLPEKTITPNRARKTHKRLADPFWRQHWREGIKRLAASDFAKGGGERGWHANFDWFLGGDTLAKILEGPYDNRPQHSAKLFPSDIKAQLKAVDELIASHPANDDSIARETDPTREQREDSINLWRRRKELQRQLAGVGHY